jgi:co-chaperonin GroES (HSP10)
VGEAAFMTPETASSPIDEAFPKVDPAVQPFGSRVLMQIRTPKKKSAGGIIFTGETQDTEKWNTQVAKVIAVGPLAFKNREKMSPWPEGEWCKPGDFVRVSKYGGDRWEVPIPGRDESAMFVIVNDLDIIGAVTGDPLQVKAFI